MLNERRAAKKLSYIVLIVPFIVLLGWVFNNEYMKRVLPGFVQMNPLTASLFIISVVAFLSAGNRRNVQAAVLALIVLLIASIRLTGFLNEHFDFGIDRILFSAQLEGNRMAPNTTFNFLLEGLALVLLVRRDRERNITIIQTLALLALTIALLAVIGYMYAALTLYQVSANIPMALHSACCFMILSLAILLHTSHSGFMDVIVDAQNGGRLARRLLPVAIFVPILLGWLRLAGERMDLYDREFGTTLLVIVIICVFSAVVWFQARQINRSDTIRKEMELELIRAKRVAEEAQQVQQQFLANMSHEIRTPMNGVIGMNNLLAGTELSSVQREYVETVKESAGNLVVIINDILDFNKIASGKLILEKIDFLVKDVIENAVKLNSYRAEEKGIQLSCRFHNNMQPAYIGDPVRLSQILMNLIGNAIKFTEAGSVQVDVMVESDTEDASVLKFVFSDTGIGIGADNITTVFESFTQASASTTRKYGGTGLGLSITKQLIELQNGNIEVHSEEGKGSVFTVFLPYRKSKADVYKIVEADRSMVQTDLFSGASILLVEDNEINQRVALHTIRKWGIEIDIASNGNEAISMLNKNHYDLILMDLQMPEMDGFETTQFIRHNMKPPVNSIPIIAMTASAMTSEMSKCLSVGMNDYITKPFQPKELMEKIGSFIHHPVS